MPCGGHTTRGEPGPRDAKRPGRPRGRRRQVRRARDTEGTSGSAWRYSRSSFPGFVSVDLIDQPERIEASKKEALAILQATRFAPGARYQDHASSDQRSGIGLRGLVLGAGGVAVASKLGLLAKLLTVFAKLLLVFKKALVVIVVGIGGFFRWLFRRRSRAAAANVADHAADADLAPYAGGLDAAASDADAPASGDPPR